MKQSERAVRSQDGDIADPPLGVARHAVEYAPNEIMAILGKDLIDGAVLDVFRKAGADDANLTVGTKQLPRFVDEYRKGSTHSPAPRETPPEAIMHGYAKFC